MRKYFFFSILFTLISWGCADNAELTATAVTRPSTDTIVVSTGGKITSIDSSKFHIKKDCFTCDSLSITIASCTDAEFQAATACVTTAQTASEYEHVKVTINSTLSSGRYYLILQEGALFGYQSSGDILGSAFNSLEDSTTANNQVTKPMDGSLYQFDVP